MNSNETLKHVSVLSNAMNNMDMNDMTNNYTEKEKDALLDWLIAKMEEFEDVCGSNKYLDMLATKLMIKNLRDYNTSQN